MTDDPRAIWERLTVAQRDALMQPNSISRATANRLMQQKLICGWTGNPPGWGVCATLTPLGLAVKAYGEQHGRA